MHLIVPPQKAWLASLLLSTSCILRVFSQSSDTLTPEQRHLVFDFGKAHNYAGFGTQLWMTPPHRQEQDMALLNLHTRYVRVSVSWNIPLQDLSKHSNYSVEDISRLLREHDTPQSQQSAVSFANEIKTLGVEMHFIYFNAPKCWLIQRGPRSWKANPGCFDNAANWIAAQLLKAKSFGLIPSHIEITNEPEGDWNTQFTPEQYDSYLLAVRNAMDANGLKDIKIAGPGCGTGTKPTVPILNVVERQDHGSLLDILSVHCYDRGIEAQDFPKLDILNPLMAKFAPGTQLFVTEYNNKAHYWGDPPYETRANERGPKNGGDTADFAISSIGDGLKLIAEGANSIFFWEASDQLWGHSDYGLIGLDGNGKPVLTATKIALDSLPWDIPVVGATGGGENLVAVAFKTPDGIRVSIVNLAPRSQAITANFKGLIPPPSSATNMRAFEGKVGEKVVIRQPVVQNATITETVPARTLVSFLIKQSGS